MGKQDAITNTSEPTTPGAETNVTNVNPDTKTALPEPTSKPASRPVAKHDHHSEREHVRVNVRTPDGYDVDVDVLVHKA